MLRMIPGVKGVGTGIGIVVKSGVMDGKHGSHMKENVAEIMAENEVDMKVQGEHQVLIVSFIVLLDIFLFMHDGKVGDDAKIA